MTLLALGVALFAACHLTLALPEAKAALRRRLGKFFGPGFGIVSLFAARSHRARLAQRAAGNRL
jgi:hypothetical protein